MICKKIKRYKCELFMNMQIKKAFFRDFWWKKAA